MLLLKSFHLRRWAAIAFAVAGAFAAIDPNDPCGRKLSSTANLTIETRADAEAFLGCDSTNSNIIISKRFPGDFTSNLKKAGDSIYVGDISSRPLIEASTLTSISFPKLTEINDDLHISGADGILSLNFPELAIVQSNVAIIDVPSLTTLNIFRRLKFVRYTSIINTGLQSLDWDGLVPSVTMTELFISNNTKMDVVSLPAVRNITGGGLYIHGNGQTKVYSEVQEVNFLQVTGVAGWLNGTNGFDSLQFSANRGASTPEYKIWDNNFDTLSFQSLEYTNGSIDIHDNPNLVGIRFPFLYRINGYLEIANNPSLRVFNYSSLDSLRSVYEINMTGSFETLELALVRFHPEALYIRSTANISCVYFDKSWEWFDIKSRYGCAANGEEMKYQANYTRPGSDDGNGGVVGSGNGGGGGIGKKGLLAIKIAVPIVGTILWGALIWCLCARRRRKKELREGVKTSDRHEENKGGVDSQTSGLGSNGNASTAQNGALAGGSSSPQQTKQVKTMKAVSRAEGLDERERNLALRERDMLDAREAELIEREKRVTALEARHSRA